MIEEQGTVVRVTGGLAEVEVKAKSACAGCDARAGCGTGALGAIFGRRRHIIRVSNHLAAEPGDQVVVGLQDAGLVSMSILGYLVPLAALLVGGAGGEAAARWLSQGAGSEGYSIIGALAGLGLGLAGLRYFWLGRIKQSSQVVLVRKVPHRFRVVAHP